MNHRVFCRIASLIFLGFTVYPWLACGYGQQGPPSKNRPAAHPGASPAGKAPAEPHPSPAASPAADARAGAAGSNDATAPEETVTDIEASNGATFSAKDRIVVFSGSVKVVDTRFQLACDKLTVFLNKSAPSAEQSAAAASTPGNTPPPDSKDATPTGGGIDHAVAEGHVIILQKRPATNEGEEKVSIGRGERGTFDNKTGDMTLTGMPSIEQNGNLHIALSRQTVMTIHKDSSLVTIGPNHTTLIQHKGASSAFDLPIGPSAPANNARPAPRRAAPSGTPQG